MLSAVRVILYEPQDPVNIAATKAAASSGHHRWGRKIKGRHMCTFFSQLADLLGSGYNVAYQQHPEPDHGQ